MALLRTLVIAQNLPYPTFGGMDLRNWQNINGFSHHSEVGVFGLHSNDFRKDELPPLRLRFWRASSDPSLAYPFPEKRMDARAWLLDPNGHPSAIYYTDTATVEVEEIMTEFEPQYVVLEGLWLHNYIQVLKKYECKIILDQHTTAAYWERMGRSITGKDLQARLFRDILPARNKTIEQRAAQAVDQIWVCSQIDAGLMKEMYQLNTPIYVIPNTVDISCYQNTRTDAISLPPELDANSRCIIFPAMFTWEPNAQAAHFLIEEFFPRLTDLSSEFQLVLPGGGPQPFMVAVAEQEPRIIVTGIVPDMRPYFAASTLMVVPLWQGGGTRLKILEAFASKIPVISTAIGAEGLDVENGKHLLFAEDAAGFVDAVQRIWTDENLAKQLVTNGLTLVKQKYSWEAVSQLIRKAINEMN